MKLWELRGGWNLGERVVLGFGGGLEVGNGFVEGVGKGEGEEDKKKGEEDEDEGKGKEVG